MKNLAILVYLVTGVVVLNGCDEDESSVTIKDIDGNTYKTVEIGNQIWMTENLKTTRYNDNTPIANVTDSLAWSNLNTAAWCWYKNDIKNKDKYGALYNWYAVGTGKLCPAGWHVATDNDFNELELYLGIRSTEINRWGWRGTSIGTKLKSTAGWADGGNGTNASGLSVVPGGYRQYIHGEFIGAGTLTYLWLSTDDAVNGNAGVAWYRRLDTNSTAVYKATTSKKGAKYVRCIMDPPKTNSGI